MHRSRGQVSDAGALAGADVILDVGGDPAAGFKECEK